MVQDFHVPHFLSVLQVFLSSKGYIHRDLAARNILLREDMTAKIADFGLCRSSGDGPYYAYETTSMPIRWMAPESLMKAEFSVFSDV